MPSTWLGVILFMLLIAPGLLFDLLGDRRRVTVKETAFRELGRTILASTAFGALGSLVAGLAHLALPERFADPAQLIGARAAEYVRSEATLVAASLMVQTLVAFAAVLAVHAVLQHRTPARLRAVSAWHDVFRDRAPKGTVAFVRVRTRSGTVWAGVVYAFSPDLAVVDRELTLGPPLASSRTNSELKGVPDVWQRVVLRDSEIEWITVKYVPRPARPVSLAAAPAGATARATDPEAQ